MGFFEMVFVEELGVEQPVECYDSITSSFETMIFLVLAMFRLSMLISNVFFPKGITEIGESIMSS